MKQASLLAIVLVLVFILLACGSNHGNDSNNYHTANAYSPESPISGPPSKTENNDKTKEESPVKIRITIGKLELTATMFDNATSRDFISLVPITLTLRDFAGTEKISDLPRKLSTQGAPSGSDPSVGDNTLYGLGGIWLFFTRILVIPVAC